MSNELVPDNRWPQDEEQAPVRSVIVDTSMASAMVRAEIDSQIATARQYPRNVRSAMKAITDLATLDEETAVECLYALVRGSKSRGGKVQGAVNKAIEGPSIRLAEIAAQCWGNCRIEARVLQVNRQEKYVEALGVFHDLESNMASTSTVRRRISTSSGGLFSEDMIVVTGNAACAIAKRNAILSGIPRGIYRPAYDSARGIVAGTSQTLSVNREKAIGSFALFGVTPDQILEALGVSGEHEIMNDQLATLRAMFVSIKNGEATVEEMFSKSEKQVDANYNPLLKGTKTGEKFDPKTGEISGAATSSVGANATNTETQESRQGDTADQSGGEAPSDTKGEAGAQATGAASPPPPADDRKADALPAATPELMREYSSALMRGEQSKSLPPLKEQFWDGKPKKFDAVSNQKLKDIYTTHVRRVAGEIAADAIGDMVDEIIAR